MADNIAAPFLTPNELTAQPGDPALGGVQVNFDPAVKAPLQPLQETFNRLDSENNASIQQKRQQERSFKHDLLTKQMDFDQQNSVLRQQKAWQNQKDLYNMLSANGFTSHTLPGPDGKPMSIPYRKEDQEVAAKVAKEITDATTKEPNNYAYSSDFDTSMAKFKGVNDNASLRAIYTAQAKQDLAGAYLPEQTQKIQEYLSKLDNTPLGEKTPPEPYVSQPSWSAKPQVDVSIYNDPKKLESFDGKLGIPNRVYDAFETTNDISQLNQGYGNFKHFLSSPEGQDPAAYAEYQKAFNELRESRHRRPIDLGGKVDANGRLVFDDSTPNKRTKIARNFLTSYNQMQTGHFQDDKDAESDELDNEVKRAQIKKYNAESHEKEQGKNTKPTKEELVEERDKKTVRSMVNNVRDVYSKVTEGKSPITPAYAGFWERNGIKPSEYDIYPSVSSNVAGKFIGILTEAESTTTDAQGAKTTTKSPASSMGVDRIVPIRDKATKELKLAYIADNKVVNIVSEKQAVSNGIKHEAHYDPKGYENKTAWVDELFDGDHSQKSGPSQTFTPKYNGADVQVRNNGGSFEANINGSWKKIKARNSKTGEIKVE